MFYLYTIDKKITSSELITVSRSDIPNERIFFPVELLRNQILITTNWKTFEEDMKTVSELLGIDIVVKVREEGGGIPTKYEFTSGGLY